MKYLSKFYAVPFFLFCLFSFSEIAEASVLTPTVTTNAVSSITNTAAVGNGDITDTGGEDPERIIEWGTVSGGPYPNNCTVGIGGTGTYSCDMTGLTQNTIYYVRARATNSSGTNPSSYENVSNNSGDSYDPVLILDNTGYPIVVWSDDALGNYEIFISRWNGSAWTEMDGTTPGYENVSNNSTYSVMPDMVLDNSGNPIVVWRDSIVDVGDEVLGSRWNGSDWVKMDGATPGYDYISNDASSAAYAPSVILDNSGSPIVAWPDWIPFNVEIFVSRWNGIEWTAMDEITPGSENISNNSYNSVESGLVLDNDGDPIVVWIDYNGIDYYGIVISRWNGTEWTKMDGITPGYETISTSVLGSYYPVMVLDDSGKPIVTWQNDNDLGNGEVVISRWNGSTWTKMDGTTPGYENVSNTNEGSYVPVVILDNLGNPMVSWIGTDSNEIGEIFISRWNGSTWTKMDGTTPGYENVSNNSGESSTPFMVLDNTENPIVVWYDDTVGNDEVVISRWNGNAWVQTDGTNHGNEVSFTTTNSGDSSEIVPDIREITDIKKGALKLNVNVDSSYANQELDFIIEIYNKDKKKTEEISATKTTDDNGEVILSVEDLDSNTEYAFRVKFSEHELDDFSAFSNYSEDATTKHDIQGDECTPTKLKVKVVSISQINLSWKDNCEAEDGYRIERKAENGEFEKVKNIGKNRESYKDERLEQGIKYIYRVRAYEGRDNSDYSNKDEATTFRKQEIIIEEPPVIVPSVIIPDVIVPKTPAPEEKAEREILKEDNNNSAEKSKSKISKTETYIKKPAVQKTSLAVEIIGLATGASLAFATSSVPLFPISSEPFSVGFSRFLRFFGILGRSKRKNNWGVVFDTETRKPIRGVTVSILNKDGKAVDSAVTDSEGRYGFLAKEGTYTMQIFKSGYILEKNKKADEFYGDLYTGESIEVAQNEMVKMNIAMKATTINWKDFAKRKIASYTSWFSIIKKDVFIIIFYAGFFVAAAIMCFAPSIFNGTIFAAYIVIAIYRVFFKTKNFGTIINKFNKPVPFSMVSLYNKQEPDRRVAFAISDVIGRYYLLAKNGDYIMKVQGQELDGKQFNKIMPVSVKGGIVKSDVII